MTRETSSERTYHAGWRLALGLTFLAFLVYIWGVKQNLPYVPEVDEKFFWVGRAVTMAGTGSANPMWFGHPGSTILYPLAAVFRLLYGASTQAVFESSPAWFYLFGRLCVVLYATASVPVIYLIGKESFGERSGLVAAWLFMFYSMPLWYFKIVRTDSAAVFFGLISMWRILKFLKAPSLRNSILAGAFVGLGISSRYFMIAGIPILFLAAILHLRKDGVEKRILGVATVGVLVALLTFVVTTPYFFLDFEAALESLRTEARTEALGADGLSRVGNLWWYLAAAIPKAITWPQYASAMMGAGVSLRKNLRVSFLILAYLAVYTILISLPALHWSRWIIPIMPLFSLFVAVGVDALCAVVFKTPTVQRAALVACVLALSAWPAYNSVSLNIRAARPSTRVLARQWIVENLPPGSRILQEAYAVPLEGTSFIVTERYTLASNGSLSAYGDEGYEVVIVNANLYKRFFAEPERYPAEIGFYTTLFESGQLLREFESTNFQGGGTLRIYKLPERVVP